MFVRFLTAALILGCLVLFFPQAAAGKAWRGILPLHSTRADVERILGPPNLEDAGYEIDGARVQITYTTQGCQDGLPSGWRVPADTVVSISVSAGDELLLNDVLVSGRNYDQIYAVQRPQLIDFVDPDEGVRYSSIEGYVLTTTYFATAADDKQLRCGEYKYAAPIQAANRYKFEQIPFDSYGRIPFVDAEVRLDNFAARLRHLNESKSNYRGFIIVYAGRSAHAGEARNTAECSKAHLVSRQKFDPELVAADGGYRDDFTVELYIMPNDAYPPMLKPTVSPKKVEILPGAVDPCAKD